MTIYYVRKTGNDSNDGSTIALAKLTIDAMVVASSSGDTIDIGPGTYSENITAGLRTFQGDGMFTTIISGTMGFNSLATFNDLKVVWPAVPNSLLFSQFTTNRVYLDMALATSGGLFPGSNSVPNHIVMDYSIIANSNAGQLRGVTGSVFQLYKSIWHYAPGGGFAGQVLVADASSFVKNCIFFNYIEAAGRMMDNIIVGGGSHSYNYFDQNQGFTLLIGEVESVDPEFEDEAGGDFRLKDTSPCIGAGLA